VRTVPVQIAPARVGVVTTAVELVGTAQAFEGITITSKVPGIVSRIAFEEGQKVGAGEVLVELDPSEMVAELEAQKAILDYARQVYQRSARLMRTENVSQARLDELASAQRAAEAKARQIEARLADLRITAPFA